jgi:hypothetical protein
MCRTLRQFLANLTLNRIYIHNKCLSKDRVGGGGGDM